MLPLNSNTVRRPGSQPRIFNVSYRIGIGLLLTLLASEVVRFISAAAHPCAAHLRDSWPWSTIAGFALGLTVSLAVAKRAATRQVLAALSLAAMAVIADLANARLTSTIGCLALGGVESLVRRAHTGSEATALS